MNEHLTVHAWVGIGLLVGTLVVGFFIGYLNVHRARGPRERRFVLRACIATWLLVVLFLGCVYFLPSPFRYVALVLFLFLIPFFIYRWATRRQLLHLVDERHGDAVTPPEAEG